MADPSEPAPDAPDPRACALLTIDVQNDFTLESSVSVIPGSEGFIPAIAGVVAAFRAHGRPIVHVIRLYDADGGNAELSRRTLVATGGPMVRPGSDGSQLRAELHPPGRGFRLDAALLAGGGLQEVGPNEWVMYKPRWGAFYETPLGPHLRACGVDSVAVVGVNFPNCPRTTIYEASERDFRIVVVPDAISRGYEQGFAECAGIGARLVPAAEIDGWLAAAEVGLAAVTAR